MPYIPNVDRERYRDVLDELDGLLATQPKGHLTFVLYTLARRFVREERYTALSEARSALQDAADEFYRCVLGPYEEKQREKNGDVL